MAFSLLVLSATVSHAQSTWNGGGGTDGNFGTAANWNTPPTSSAANTLDFAGSVGLNATNNITLNSADQTINFNAGASSFTIWPSTTASAFYIRLGGVANNSSVIQTIMPSTEINGTRTINVGTAGLILGAPIGSTSTSGRTATITGTGNLIILGGTTVSGGSSYNVTQGGLVFSNATAATLGTGANGVSLTASGTTLQFDNSGTLSMSNAITTVAGSSITLNNSANVAVTNGITLTGASLTGTGHLISAVSSVGGSIAPGNSGIGTIFVTSLSLDAASTTTMEINRAGESSDLISASGALTYGGTLDVDNIGAALEAGDSFDLFSGTISGTFASTSLPSLSAGLSWDTSQLNSAGIIDVTAVPEPATLALLGIGGLMAGWQIRRRKA